MAFRAARRAFLGPRSPPRSISGYAAILGSKFTTATPTQIVNRLLSTARKDTLLNYNAATYGMGEASLANAVAPNKINSGGRRA